MGIPKDRVDTTPAEIGTKAEIVKAVTAGTRLTTIEELNMETTVPTAVTTEPHPTPQFRYINVQVVHSALVLHV